MEQEFISNSHLVKDINGAVDMAPQFSMKVSKSEGCPCQLLVVRQFGTYASTDIH